MAEQFLTLMADLDENSQKIMSDCYKQLQQAGYHGTQTPGLPYHISLRTIALDQEQNAIREMERIADEFAPMPVHISHIGLFESGRVLFAAPDMNPCGLLRLHDAVQTESIDEYPWTPHATILIDETATICSALPVLLRSFHAFTGTVTRLHLCAFWPTREIASVELHGAAMPSAQE